MYYDFTIIGAGIVGLSVGLALTEKYKDANVLILEKEKDVAKHQTGRNSGVIHSGIYYNPGSLKAQLAKKGNSQMKEFCSEHDIPYDNSGKLIAATQNEELDELANLHKRAVENGLNVSKVDEFTIKEIEPHLKGGIAGLYVPSTGIVDYRKVAKAMADIIKKNNGKIWLNEEVRKIESLNSEVNISTENQKVKTKYLINCTGLMSDKVTNMSGVIADMKIVPFRGEYYELVPSKRHLVNNLIYPVPNPDFPFLGIHFTRMMNGKVLVGPNAVLSLKREGYKKNSINIKETLDTLSYPGFWKLAFPNAKEGIKEMYRSYNKRAFVKDLQRFIPAIEERDLIAAASGVRAQALDNEGNLLDDFLIINDKNIIHVCNAPSPAATASIEIGKEIVRDISKKFKI